MKGNISKDIGHTYHNLQKLLEQIIEAEKERKERKETEVNKQGHTFERGVTRDVETTDHERTGSAQNEQYSGKEGKADSEEEPLEELTDGELSEVEKKPVSKVQQQNNKQTHNKPTKTTTHNSKQQQNTTTNKYNTNKQTQTQQTTTQTTRKHNNTATTTIDKH